MASSEIDEKQLIQLLNQHYSIQADSVQRLNLGADMNAAIYRVAASSASYFVKIKPASHDETALAVIQHLRNANIKEIIFPVSTLQANLSLHTGHEIIIVYPYIDGRDGFTQPLTQPQWVQFGKLLRSIHTLTLPAVMQQSIRKESYSTKWRDIVKALPAKMVANQGENQLVRDFKIYYQSELAVINRLVNTAEQLCNQIPSNTSNYVLCHSDCHAGNILMTADGTFYLVDWDEPILAPKERDLMFIGAGVGNVWNSQHETAYFYQGYGNTEINKTILSYYRHERIIEDIAVYTLDILADAQDTQTRLISFNHFKSQFEPNGVVDIALNSSV